jgi:dihydrofolate reductase
MIRQALDGGHVDELTVSIAPVILGAGKRLFEGFEKTVGLGHIGVLQSLWATHVRYRVVR